VTFGAAFLGDEKAESFMWLFDKFLGAMGVTCLYALLLIKILQ